jgi:PTH1 family peptidyl-tRNA hydrolase
MIKEKKEEGAEALPAKKRERQSRRAAGKGRRERPLLARKRNPLPRRRSNPVLGVAAAVESMAPARIRWTRCIWSLVWETRFRIRPHSHNAGFMAVERFGKKFSAEWKGLVEFHSRVRATRGCGAGRKVILCEPQTYMNASGEAIAAAGWILQGAAWSGSWWWWMMRICRFGQIRLRGEGSSGGHHGLESIEEDLATREVCAVASGDRPDGARLARDYRPCARPVQRDEAEVLEKVLERCASQIECYLTQASRKR